MMNDAQTGNITGHNTIASALTNIVTGKLNKRLPVCNRIHFRQLYVAVDREQAEIHFPDYDEQSTGQKL